MHLLGYVFFVFAGLIFGLFGSGGSIIIIPILIYIFKLSIYEATTYSLLLVFLISFFGTLQHIKHKNLHIKNISTFIIPTLFFTCISRLYIFPAIPDHIGLIDISKETLLMILFSFIVFCSAISLFKTSQYNFKYDIKIIFFVIGMLVGILTGLLGIGGGFIIVPVLVLFAKMNMKEAASSTLFIIMLNTFLAIILEITVFQFKFQIVFITAILFSAIIGMLIGIYLLNKINVNVTKKLFSVTLLLLSLIIFLFEII